MKKIFILLFTFNFSLFALHSIAQTNVEFTKKNFPNDLAGLKKAKDSLREGDKYYSIKAAEWHIHAVSYYLAANKFNPNNAMLNYKIGACYLSRFSPFKTMAIPYLEAAYKLNPNVAKDIHYVLGQAYHFDMQWDKAIQEYNAYLLTLDQKKNAAQIADTKKKIDECHNGIELVKHPARVIIDNMGPSINTQYPEHGPIITANESEMIFTSRRPAQGVKIADDGLPYENLYISLFRNGNWLPATNMGEPINLNTDHEATAGLSPDGQILYIYEDYHNGDIYQSVLEGGEWTKPQKMGGKINSRYRETSLSLAADNKTLYLVSNRPGGYGGQDIYKVVLSDKAKWGEPVNLGPTINTQYDEEGADIQADGKTLYFSSKGHNTMGGYDIFKSTYDSGKWSEPENLGYPVNTPDDDVFFTISANGKHGYYASIRKDGYGETDIYKITFLGEEKPMALSTEETLLAGNVSGTDVILPPAKNNFGGKLIWGDGSAKPLANVIIALIDTTGKVVDSVETNEFGSFLFYNVVSDQQYDFKLFLTPSNMPPCPKLYVTDRQGNIIKEILLTVAGAYEFKLLASDSLNIKRMGVDDPQLRYRMRAGLVDGDNKAISSVKVKMHDNTGKVVLSTVTDSSGIFTFNDLPMDRTYMVEIDTTDSKLSGLHKVFLTDGHGHIIRELKFGKDYRFNVLPADYRKMGTIDAYDPWLAALNLKNSKKENKLSIIENIYFDYQKWDILPAAATTLSKVVQVMNADPTLRIELDAYTDSRGNDQFNLQLSQKRADAAVAYMVQHGISKTRVSGKGFGKAHPLNKCGDPNVHCTEEEYAVNRRIEFKITRTTK
ncbi:MAG: OmpA family protein [Bacteroidia bacterium]